MFPGLRDLVLKVVASHSVTSTTHTAIQGLLDIIKESGKPAKPRVRYMRPVWVKELYDLAMVQYRKNWKPVERKEFMPLNGNDFSVLTRWGMVEQGHIRGTWTITKLGIKFLLGKLEVPDHVRFNGNAAEPRWSFDHYTGWVSSKGIIGDAEHSNYCHTYLMLGLKSGLPSISLNIAPVRDKGMWLPPSWAV